MSDKQKNMQFEKGYIYHIFNQGNNKQKVFFNRDNYIFFLQKIKIYILPYADILSWCLMPNHFHLMVLVNETELEVEALARSEGFDRQVKQIKTKTEGFAWSETLGKQVAKKTDTFARSEGINKPTPKYRSINNSIGIMLRSYTNAINKEQNRSGSLFRKKTKAECINCPNGITPSFLNNRINVAIPEKQYPQVCFNYVHENPVKANLAKRVVDWEFSSARDYFDNRKGKLINKNIAKEYVDIY